ncbi:hypothetical protein L7F22_019020 [Adiantum nelumboides]|nr:hypothetical protein [Adiantum nelumboides]
MPKVKRRLRDDERKLIKSGQVFVFDEKESGIKRWTDGLLWSPSRILFNFLVYRQVEKKATTTTATTTTTTTTTTSAAAAAARSVSQQGNNSPSNPSGSTEQLNSLALGAIGFADPSFSSPSNMNTTPEVNRIRSSSAASDTFSGWESLSMLEGFNVAPTQSTSSANVQSGLLGQNDRRNDRSLVDGIPRFDGEDESTLLSRREGQESSGEGTSSGSEAQQFQRQHQARPHSMQGHSRGRSFGSGTSRGRAMTLAGQTQGQNFNTIVSSSSQPLIRAPPLPHQIGGSGNLASSRRSFDAISRSTRNRYEPYPGSTIGTTFSNLPFGQDQIQNDFFGSGGMQNGTLRIGGDSNGMFTAMSMSPSPTGANISSMMAPQHQQQQQQQNFATNDHANPAIFSTFPELNSFDVQSTQPMNLTSIHNHWQDDNVPNQSSFIPIGSSDPSSTQQPISSLQHPSVSRVRYPTNNIQNTGIEFDTDHHHHHHQQQQIPFNMTHEAQSVTAPSVSGTVIYPYNQLTDNDNVQPSGMPSDSLISPFTNTITTGDVLIEQERISSPRKQIFHRARESQHFQNHLQQEQQHQHNQQQQQQQHSRQPHFQYQQFHQEQGQAQSPNENLHGQAQAQTSYSGMNSIFLSKPEQ